MINKLEVLLQKAPEAPCLVNSVTSSHLHSLEFPSSLSDFQERDVLLQSFPLARKLFERGYPLRSLVSLFRCGTYTGDGVKVLCGCKPRIIRLRYHCSNRSCPYCARIRKRRVYRKFMPMFMNMVTTSLNRVRFLTISPRNYSTYAEGEAHLRESLSKLWRRKYFKERVQGGMYVIEAKSSFKGWNVHAHVVYYGRELNTKLYGYCSSCRRRMWLKYDHDGKRFYCSKRHCNSVNVVWDGRDSVLNQELKQVFSCDVRGHVKNVYSRGRSHHDNVQHSLNYCLKYVSINKGSFVSLDDFAQYIVSTRSRRLVSTFGVFYSNRCDAWKPSCSKCDFFFSFEYVLDVNFLNNSLGPP